MNTGPEMPLVVHVVYALGTGGLENGMINLINRIPRDRFRHAIVCIKESGEFARRITTPGVEIIELGKREGHDLGFYWRLWKTLRRLRPAIVHTRNIAAIEAQFFAALIPGTRRVHGEHGRDIYDVAGENRKYRLLRRLLNPFINCFIAVSRDLEQWLCLDVGIPQRKIVQIYNGVDVSSFTPDGEAGRAALPPGFLGEDAIVIGTVGRLAAIKDQAALIRAIRSLLERDASSSRRLRLVIIGDGPLRTELEQQLEEAALDGVTWMAGNRNDIAALLRVFDIFVLPSLGEGISNTILEAMASGLPVVASRVGGNPELVTDGVNGILFPAGDSEALAAALGLLCEDTRRRQQMAQQARSRALRDFSWDAAVHNYCRVYDGLLNSRQLQGAV